MARLAANFAILHNMMASSKTVLPFIEAMIIWFAVKRSHIMCEYKMRISKYENCHPDFLVCDSLPVRVGL